MAGSDAAADEVTVPLTPAVEDWTTDYDIFDAEYITDPYPIWADMRGECPVAQTDRWGGSFLPTRYEDVVELARMVPVLSSHDPIVVRPPEGQQVIGSSGYHTVNAPPISADPPVHTWSRRLILPAFAPRAVEAHETYTRALAGRLVDGFIADGRVDGAQQYAQQIPPRVIAHLLGVDEGRAEEFTDWVRGVLEIGLSNPAVRAASREKIMNFFAGEVADRRANPKDDLISELMAAEIDGEPVSDEHIIGTCNLMLVAGIDTTWSSIGSALWHLATHDDDRRRIAADLALLPTAVEEFLRAYSPVTMARVVSEETEFKGCPMHVGDKVLMNFPAANRDPEVFENPDFVDIDRQRNRHIAFGVGIHRCAGSNLARMEMVVALEVFLTRIPEFRLEDPSAVTWAGGQVRGPRRLPLVF